MLRFLRGLPRGASPMAGIPTIDFFGSADAPLVSILIPAYNPRYLADAIASALGQTYASTEIIVCNDNPSSRIESVVRQARSERIAYVENEKNLGAVATYIKCFELARGTYIKYLNDDDLLDRECVKRMVTCFEVFGDRVTLVTSKRSRVDPEGRLLADNRATRLLTKKDAYVDGHDLADFVLRHALNVIGEPTTALFRKRDVEGLRPDILSIDGMRIEYNVDVALWLNLLSRGDAVYISEPLSSLRIHEAQEQRNPRNRFGLEKTWFDFVVRGRRMGLLRETSSYGQALSHLAGRFASRTASGLLDETENRELERLRTELLAILAGIPGPARGRRAPIESPSDDMRRIRKNEGWREPFKYRFVRWVAAGDASRP